MQQILTALSECRKKIEKGADENKWPVVGAGIFGLKVMEIMLSEPKAEVHVFKMDGKGEAADPFLDQIIKQVFAGKKLL